MNVAKQTADAITASPNKTENARFIITVSCLMLIAVAMFNFSNRLTRIEAQFERYQADVTELRSMIRTHSEKGE